MDSHGRAHVQDPGRTGCLVVTLGVAYAGDRSRDHHPARRWGFEYM
jgi:hypothetical protein